jgi:hypothetical protein
MMEYHGVWSICMATTKAGGNNGWVMAFWGTCTGKCIVIAQEMLVEPA